MSQKSINNFELNSESSTDFLFDISKQVKQFYTRPIIFLTQRDYSDVPFNTLCSMRPALQKYNKNDIIDIIVNFHIKWLNYVNEIEEFTKRLNNIQRIEIYEAINFTIEAISSRCKLYLRYIAKYRPSLSNENQLKINADSEIVEEMHTEISQGLLNTLLCFRNFDSDDNFKIKLKDAIDDLLNWIDSLYDNLCMILCKYINVNVPHIRSDLAKTLQQIVGDLKNSKSPVAQKLFSDFKAKGKHLEMLVRSTAEHSLEIAKLVEKITKLNDRISRLESEPNSAALMALRHKKVYLETILNNLENTKIDLRDLQNNIDIKFEEANEEEVCICDDFFQLRIFNHDLPSKERELLVSELCHLWNKAVFGGRSDKSIISILSAADNRDEFTDDLGTFHIDEYSRKIYKIPDDETFYQVNEQGILIPLSDDSEHVYFYDECGRYYINQNTRLRIYKEHSNASEYMLDTSGTLLKLKEERDGVVYYYDNYGRYYINDEGSHIYREADSMSEYENDGLGNLVRIRSHLDIFEPCPADANVTEESRYLQIVVGDALKKCIADVIIHQPSDPIKYLSASLLKYRENIERKEKEIAEKKELDVEREIKIAEEREAARLLEMEAPILPDGGSEVSYDFNLINYTSMQIYENDSDKTNSK